MAVTNLAALRNGTTETALVTPGFETVAGFEALQRMAHIFHESNIVPERFSAYSRNANKNVTFGNVVIALDMALRMRANPLMVFQSLCVVQGNPSWSSQFLVATFNQSGKYSALRYEFEGKPGTDAWGCKAVATELATNTKLEGTLITIGMAKAQGWYGKPGSKWQTMPEQMLRYRAAAWFIRAYAPEIAMGLKTVEEVQETIDLEQTQDGSYTVSEQPQKKTITTQDIKASAQAQPQEAPQQAAQSVQQAPEQAQPQQAPQPAPQQQEPAQQPDIDTIANNIAASMQHQQQEQPQSKRARKSKAAPEPTPAQQAEAAAAGNFRFLKDKVFWPTCIDAKVSPASVITAFREANGGSSEEAIIYLAQNDVPFQQYIQLVLDNPGRFVADLDEDF